MKAIGAPIRRVRSGTGAIGLRESLCSDTAGSCMPAAEPRWHQGAHGTKEAATQITWKTDDLSLTRVMLKGELED